MIDKLKSWLKSETGFKVIFIILFLLINFFNLYIINSDIYIKDMFVIPKTFKTVLSCFLGDMGVLLTLLGFAFILFKKDINAGKYLIWVTSILSILMTGVSIYYSYYKTFPSIWNLNSLGTGNPVEVLGFFFRGLFNLLKYAQYLFLLPMVFFIIIWYLYPHKLVKKYKNNSCVYKSILSGKKRIIFGLCVVIVGALGCSISTSIYNINKKEKGYEQLKITAEAVQSVGIINYYLDEFKEYITLEENNKVVSQDILKQLEIYKNKELMNNEYTGVFEGKNLLMIQIESLNNYMIGLEVNVDGYNKEVTPNLNKIINKESSAYFSNYYTTVGIGNTSDAEFTVLTGIYPEGFSYTVNEYSENMDYQTLPKLFKNKGYYSFSSHANTGTFYSRSTLHPELYGFDYHIDEETLIKEGIYNEDNLVHNWVNDVEFLNYTIDVMKNQSDILNKPIFNFAITISCHMPYEINLDEIDEDDPSINMFKNHERFFPLDYSKEYIDEEMMAYIEHVYYTDYAIGKAIEKLQSTGLLENTVVILYGDHGGGIDCTSLISNDNKIMNNTIETIDTVLEEDIYTYQRKLLLEVPLIIYDGSEKVKFDKENYLLVRNHTTLLSTISNLFNLDMNYVFSIDAFSSEKMYCYNPRNIDIIIDGAILSGISREILYDSKYNGKIYTQKEIEKIINDVLRYKNFNDSLLKHQIFKKIEIKN